MSVIASCSVTAPCCCSCHTSFKYIILYNCHKNIQLSMVIYNIQLITLQQLYGQCFGKQMNQMDASWPRIRKYLGLRNTWKSTPLFLRLKKFNQTLALRESGVFGRHHCSGQESLWKEAKDKYELQCYIETAHRHDGFLIGLLGFDSYFAPGFQN